MKKMKKYRGIIVFLIVVFTFGAIFDYYNDKLSEQFQFYFKVV